MMEMRLLIDNYISDLETEPEFMHDVFHVSSGNVPRVGDHITVGENGKMHALEVKRVYWDYINNIVSIYVNWNSSQTPRPAPSDAGELIQKK